MAAKARNANSNNDYDSNNHQGDNAKTNDCFGDNEDDNVELNKYKWVHPSSPLGLIYPTNAAILHRGKKID